MYKTNKINNEYNMSGSSMYQMNQSTYAMPFPGPVAFNFIF